MIIPIIVTAEDLREGIRQDCQFFPVARAISRTLASLRLFEGPVYVSYSHIELIREYGRLAKIFLEDDMRSYIWAIDQEKDVEPRHFMIEYPRETI